MRWPRRTHVAAKVVLRDGIGRVLVLRRSGTDPRRPYTWDLPGGTVEFGTDPADAAVREVREETGITTLAGRLRPLGVESSYGRDTKVRGRNGRRYVIRLVFTATVGTAGFRYAPVVPVLSREHDEYRWLSVPAEAEGLDMPGRYKRHVLAALASREARPVT